MIYFLIALFATVIGSFAGIGGGVIVKPVLDLVSDYSATAASLLSSFTILSMAITSTIRHIKLKTHIEKGTAFLLGIGAVAGGIIGDTLLMYTSGALSNDNELKVIQNIVLSILLSFVLIYMLFLKEKLKFNVKNRFFILVIGVLLGTVSAYLGIGGGPINVAILTLFFSMDAKNAAVNSIVLIVFSQSAKILNVIFTTGLGGFDLTPLFFMIPAGILGGIIGSTLNKRLKNQHILLVYSLVLIFIVIINLVNVFLT